MLHLIILYCAVEQDYLLLDRAVFILCCGSGMFIPDPGSWIRIFLSRIQCLKDPGSGSALKSFCILTQKLILSSRKNDLVCSFRIPDPDFFPSRIPNLRYRGQSGIGSRIRIRNTVFIIKINFDRGKNSLNLRKKKPKHLPRREG